MLLSLAYQAPWLPRSGGGGDDPSSAGGRSVRTARPKRNNCMELLPSLLLFKEQVAPPSLQCTLAHLIGLFRLHQGESLLSLGYRGAVADVLLWVLIRVQVGASCGGSHVCTVSAGVVVDM